MRLISNSEVSSWLHCTRKYYYEYVLDLEPKVQSGPISDGVLIHAMLEQYYIAKADNFSEDEARAAALQPVMDAVNSGMDYAEAGRIRDLVTGYFAHYTDDFDRYEVFAIESKFKAELTDEYALVGTLDLVLRDKQDGRYVGVDHKSSYNFWTADQAALDGQFTKYIFILRSMGLDVKSFMVNMIRTRKLKPGNEFYRREFVVPTEVRMRNVMRQHFMAANRIMEFRAQGAPKEETIPIYSKYNCGNCPFLAICDADTEGSPTQYVIESEYQKRQNYGYNKESLVHEG